MIGSSRSRTLAILSALMVLGAALWPTGAAACAVCYGDAADNGFLRGAQWATLLMVAVTYTMLSGGVALFVVLRRRAKRASEDEGAAAVGRRHLESRPDGLAAGHQGAE